MPEIFENWGFGMAPPKPGIHRQRLNSASNLLGVLSELLRPEAEASTLDSLSEVKGLFNRIVRQDQWDWFTVCGQLGYPSQRISNAIARQITNFRAAIRLQDALSFAAAHESLCRLPTRKGLSIFCGFRQIRDEENAGWVYILSIREEKHLLKIGMTTRRVEDRAREINSATGVVIPYGVRGCWRVIHPARSEKPIHAALTDYRVRRDREFFRMDFRQAGGIIQNVLNAEGLQIRTLDRLAALSEEGQ